MAAWIISLPLLIGLAITVGVMILAGMASYLCIRRVPANEEDVSAQRMADHIRRVLGVLLGLMLSTVFAFSSGRTLKIQDNIEVEAAELGDLHHDLSRLDSNEARQIRGMIADYITAVVEQEWPSLAAGKASDTTNRMFLEIEDRLLTLSGETEYHRELKSRLLQDMDQVSDLRQARVFSAGAGLDWYICMVILSFSLLLTTFRFYAPTRWTMFFLISYAVLIGIVLYSTVALHYPFRSGRVSFQPFESLTESMRQ
jgi:hypothetical protein